MISENRVSAHARPQLSQDKLDRDAGSADHGLAAHNLWVDLNPRVRHFVGPAPSAGIAMRPNPRNTSDKQAPDVQQIVPSVQNGKFRSSFPGRLPAPRSGASGRNARPDLHRFDRPYPTRPRRAVRIVVDGSVAIKI